jgi:predicted component of type VI protein secretion system
MVGRGSGPLFDHDVYLSPSHTRIIFDAGRIILEDVGSLNGVFVKIATEEPLRSGDIFRIGQELLRFDAIREPQVLPDGTEIMGSPNPGYWGRLSVIMGPGVDGSAFPLMGEEMLLGRERGDILFSDDGYVSGTHAKISVREDGFFLGDLGSSNGTFIRIAEPRVVTSGSFMLIGQQLFRIDLL